MEQEARENFTPELEKRRQRRTRLITQVRCETLGREELMVTRDISVGGMFIFAKDPFPENLDVQLAFRLGLDDPLITCWGKVVYSVRALGMGIQFSDLPEEARATLQNFVDAGQ